MYRAQVVGLGCDNSTRKSDARGIKEEMTAGVIP